MSYWENPEYSPDRLNILYINIGFQIEVHVLTSNQAICLSPWSRWNHADLHSSDDDFSVQFVHVLSLRQVTHSGITSSFLNKQNNLPPSPWQWTYIVCWKSGSSLKVRKREILNLLDHECQFLYNLYVAKE